MIKKQIERLEQLEKWLDEIIECDDLTKPSNTAYHFYNIGRITCLLKEIQTALRDELLPTEEGEY